MSGAEWSLLAQVGGVLVAAIVLVVVVNALFTREAVLAAAAAIVVALGAYGLVTGMHNELMGTAAARTRWLSADEGRAKCIADAADQKWLPVIQAARARLRDGDHYAVVSRYEVDLACLQLQLLPALGVKASDRRAHLLISFGRVPAPYRALPQQAFGEGVLLTRP